MKRLLICTVVLTLAFASLGESIEVSLTRLSTLYLPTYSANGSRNFPFPTVTVEQLAFHNGGKLIYGVGDKIIHIINASDVNNLRIVDYLFLPDLELTDVEVCGDGVFIPYRNNSNLMEGGVLVYQAYNTTTRELKRLHNIPMGALPDMVYPTRECTIVVAIENEGVVINGQFYDPAGGVGIIRFPSGIAAQPETKVLNFTKFDNQFDQLSQSGVRWIYRDNNNSFSNNIEPEYITFNSDHTIAYICLQENNAIAVVDLRTDDITAIHGLNFKKWGALDASDRDGGINITNWPVYGMYQPDSIEFVHWNGQDYIFTANEGDAQEYDFPVDFSEEIRGKDIKAADIDPSVSDAVKNALMDDAKLGRLTFSNVDRNAQGKFDKFYAYGARSFSIFRASNMQLAFDSGSDLEHKTAELRPDIFNANVNSGRTKARTKDTRSDNKGPETESVTAGEVEGHLVIFAGNERPGTIAVYSVAPGGMSPQFQTLYTGGIPENTTKTWGQMFDERTLSGIDPEYIKFFSPSDGLADYPVLLMAGTVTGTVSVLKVEVKKPTDTDDPSNVAVPLTPQPFLLFVLCFVCILLHPRHH